MSSRTQPHAPRRVDELDDLPPPYTPVPTDEVSLEFGPTRPFQPPPQQLRQQPRQQPQRQQPGQLSDFARDFYAAGDGASRSVEQIPHRPPPSQPQNSIPDDGRPTRTPVPGHPLLNNGKTLVYPPSYECYKCHNTGYKSFDPSHPCRRCWEKYSKPYSGPIVYSSWNDGPSNRQRPLSYLRSSATSPSLSPSRSLSSIANQVRNDLSSVPSNSDRRSHPPSSPAAYPPPRFPVPPPLPARPQSDYTMNRSTSSAWTRNGPSSPPVLRPGDPRIGGNLCWNCHGSGRTFGFLLLTNNTCDLCGGVGRLL